MRASRLRLKAAVTPLRVVIGRDQDRRIFLRSTPIRTTLSLPSSRAALARNAPASSWVRLPMVEPEKKPSLLPSPRDRGQRARLGEVGDQRRDGEAVMLLCQPLRRFGQAFAGNVDRHIGRDAASASISRLVLRDDPEPNSTSTRASPDEPGDLGAVGLEQRGLDPGRVIFRELGDLLEQRRAGAHRRRSGTGCSAASARSPRAQPRRNRRAPDRPRRRDGSDGAVSSSTSSRGMSPSIMRRRRAAGP